MLLLLLPDKNQREREAGREGRGPPRGSCTRKRGVIPKKTKFWGWVGLEGNVWVFEGDGLQFYGMGLFGLSHTRIQQT